MSRVEIPYRPREAFKEYHSSNKRYAVSICHRRAGKTVARINKLVRAAIQCKKVNPRFRFICPFYVQAKDIAWAYLKFYCQPLIALGAKVNESELTITLPHNNAVIKLYGAENADRMRGLYSDGDVLDEAQDIPKEVLTTVIFPALLDRGGWLDVSGTPRGWENLLGEIAIMAGKDPENWFMQILRADDSGILPEEELARARALMSENEFSQEFLCSFDAAITGAVYGKQVAAMELSGRIKEGIYDPKLPVHTSWDLGRKDATAIWFWQKVMGEVRLVNYYENHHDQIGDYCDVLDKMDYTWGHHYVPHDAKHKILAAGGRSIIEQAYARGYKMFAVPATSVQNGIEATRKLLEYTWLDPVACAQGLRSLKAYQHEWDKDKKIYRDKPRHDWASNGCDSLEIIGQVWRDDVKPEEPARPRFLHEVTANEVFWENTSHAKPNKRI